jgi:hypothetical protein
VDDFRIPCAEIGAVKFFDERPGKKFGFALVLDNDGYSIGEEIFFHYNEGEFVYDEEGIPTFGQAIKYKYSDAETKSTYTFDDFGHGYWPPFIKRMWCETVHMPVPRKGDHIVFRRGAGTERKLHMTPKAPLKARLCWALRGAVRNSGYSLEMSGRSDFTAFSVKLNLLKYQPNISLVCELIAAIEL